MTTRTQPQQYSRRSSQRVAAPRAGSIAAAAAAGLLLLLGTALLTGCAGPAAQADGPGAGGDRWLRFTCASGTPVDVRYAADGRTVLVRRDSREYRMELARSASGARYAGAGLEWWTRGSGAGATGSLLRHGAHGGPGATLDDCTWQ